MFSALMSPDSPTAEHLSHLLNETHIRDALKSLKSREWEGKENAQEHLLDMRSERAYN